MGSFLLRVLTLKLRHQRFSLLSLVWLRCSKCWFLCMHMGWYLLLNKLTIFISPKLPLEYATYICVPATNPTLIWDYLRAKSRNAKLITVWRNALFSFTRTSSKPYVEKYRPQRILGPRKWALLAKGIKIIMMVPKHSLWRSDWESVDTQLPNVSSHYYYLHPFPFPSFSFSLCYYDCPIPIIGITKQREHLVRMFFAAPLIATSEIIMLKPLL